MRQAFICAAVRAPIGRYGGTPATVFPDDLTATPIRKLMQRNPSIDWQQIDEVILCCADQAGEDKRSVARSALLLVGLQKHGGTRVLAAMCIGVGKKMALALEAN